MYNWLTEAARQAPALIIFAAMVYIFLRHLQTKERASAEMAKRCHDVQEKSFEAINENTKMLGEVSVILRVVNGKLR